MPPISKKLKGQLWVVRHPFVCKKWINFVRIMSLSNYGILYGQAYSLGIVFYKHISSFQTIKLDISYELFAKTYNSHGISNLVSQRNTKKKVFKNVISFSWQTIHTKYEPCFV